jgi:hypothetical protein
MSTSASIFAGVIWVDFVGTVLNNTTGIILPSRRDRVDTITMIEIEPGEFSTRQELQRRQCDIFWRAVTILAISFAVIFTLGELGIG